MSQEYTEDKDIVLTPMSSGRRLLEALIILMALFAVYLMVSLVSFNPSDPSWSQTAWHEPIHNLGGEIGAWLADTLLFIFGVMAYAIPFIILGFCWFGHRQRYQQPCVDCFAISLRLIGVLSLVVTTCGLAAINADDIWYFASGGVIGSLVSTAMHQWFSPAGGTLTLLFIWAAGITLYTGWSWLTIAEKIGACVMGILTFASHRHTKHNRWQYPGQSADTAREDDGLPLLAKSGAASAEQYDPLLDYTGQRTQPTSGWETDSVNPLAGTPMEKNALPAGDQAVTRVAAQGVSPQSGSPVEGAAYVTPPESAESSVPAPQKEFVHCHFELPDAEDLKPVTPDFSAAKNVHPNTQSAAPLTDNPAATSPEGAAKSAGLSSFAVAASMGKLTPSAAALQKPQSGSQPQVKQGMGPELPRPNPIRIPTRRELASYGIKLPSQREVEKNARTEPLQQDDAGDNEQQNRLEEMQLREAFQRQQAERYGSDRLAEAPAEDEEEIRHQAELAQQFAASQQQRYISSESDSRQVSAVYDAEPPSPEIAFDPVSGFINSPAGDLSDDAADESLFTLAADEYNPPPGVSEPSAPQSATTVTPSTRAAQADSEQAKAASAHDSLFHPFLIRHEQPLSKPTTPLPALELLTSPPEEQAPIDMFALEQTGQLVEARLADFRVKAEVVGISPGPVITRFELDLAPGVKAARISNLSRDLARSLSAVAVRIVEVIPGKPYVGLELPNVHRQTVYLREVLDCPAFRDDPSPLTVVLGKDISGEPVVADLAKMPHLLVAGTTGSGKSVGVNAMILSMLYKATPDEVRFIMIDPKMLELSVYEGIPHLLTEVVTDMKDAANALRWSVIEMEKRYRLMSALGVRNLAGYNEKIEQAAAMGRPIPDPFWKPGDSMESSPPVLEKLPYIVVLVDEFADLMMAVGKKVEELIARLAQKARAAGIHLVLATQRPSVDVITGLIKANIPTRIAFTVSSKIDSRTILDQGGAESLLGMGDMLYMPPNSSMPVRVHGAFVRDQEVHAVVQDWKARGRPQYIDSITVGDDSESSAAGDSQGEELDPLFDQAVGFVVEKRRASISGVQRQFRIGYNRAARIIEQMEAQGIVSEPGHNGNREVLSPPPHDL